MRLVSRFPLVLWAAIVGCLLTSPVRGQVPLTTLGSATTQSFNSLATTGTNPWLDNTTLIGWYSQFSANPANPTTYIANDGSSNTGAIYSYGTGTNTERAFGSASSGTPVNIFNAVRLVNNTGSTITSLDISYVGEQWRNGGNAAAQQLEFQYQVVNPGTITDANTPTTGWNDFNTLDFVSPTTGATAAALDGNAAANRTAKSGTLTVVVNAGQEIWLRWLDINDAGNDHGLAVDDLSVTPQGVAGTTLNIGDATQAEGDPPGTTTFTFAVTLTAPAGPGGVTFDIATADGTAQDDNPAAEDNDYVAQSLTGQSIPTGSTGPYNFSVTVNRDLATEPNETFFVNVTNVTGATGGDTQGLGTIQNDDVTLVFIHDVQGNGAATPIPGATVTVEGVVTANFQGNDRLQGFFLQEENADVDADPATSEGIFIFCGGCPTPVAEGQRVRATGTVSEFFGLTEITASTAGSVVVTNAGNNLAQVTAATVDLPVVGDVNTFYETRESMLVNFVDPLTVSEYFELARFGQIELYEGGRPRQFTEMAPPNVAGYTAHLDNLNRRRVILDDDDNAQNSPLLLPDGSQFVFHPRANGGLSVGTQGTDFFRGGDLVTSLTGVLHWSFAGFTGTDAWRVRPTAATPATFTVANPRPATPPAVGGAIRAVSMNLLNYFTTIDTTASNNTGTCGPSGTQDCRGADSVAELNRQRERASIVICGLNAHVYGFNELENTTASATITDLLGAVNARCGGANPYAFVNTGGTLGTDAIRVIIIYRTGILSPVGAALVDLDPVHNRPPTAQTFDVVDAANPAFGERFTVIPNHFKSKGCPGTGADADAGDGASCFNGARTAQASRLLTWINTTVLPAAGDPDVLLLGDFNSYAEETPITTLEGGGFVDLVSTLLGASAYSYVFDGQLGHLDYAFASTSLATQVTGAGVWHINADEIPLFDYNDEVRDTGEADFEEDPDGSALVPPRVVFQPASPYRASDHDPVIVGLFGIADLSVTKTDTPDPVTAGTNLTYTITVTNAGPDPATTASWSDTLPAGTAFVSLPVVAGWSCTTPAVGSGGTVSCSNPSFAVGSAVFTLTVSVSPSVAAGTVITNTATATAATGDGNPGNDSGTATTTVAASADLSVTKVDTPDPVTAGSNLTYTITVANAGPSNAATVSLADTLPPGTTFVSLASPGGWSCTTPAVGAGGTVTCSFASLPAGSAVFTLTVAVAPGTAAGTVISNTAAVTAATADPTPGNGSATATTTVAASADLSVTKVDTPDPVTAGSNITYTITVANAGPSNAATVSLSDTLPAGTTFVSLSSPGGWSCTSPAVGAGGTVSCSLASLPAGSAVFTLVVAVAPGTAPGSVITNTATVTSATPDPTPGNGSATATTTVGAGSADLSVTKTGTGAGLAGTDYSYTITVANAGPSAAASVSWSDTLPALTTFVSLSSPAGWSCTTPAVGSGGTVSCSNPSFAPDPGDTFTLVIHISSGFGTSALINTVAVTSTTPDPDPADNSDTEGAGVDSSADLAVTKVDSVDPVQPGTNLTYTITLTNNGPSDAPSTTLSDPLPAGTTFVSFAAAAGFTCTTPAVGATGTVSCSNGTVLAGASAVFTLTVQVGVGVAPGTVLTNTAAADAPFIDPNSGNDAGTATTTVGVGSADLSITKVDTPDPVNAGANLTYTITATNAGPSDAATAAVSDTLPAGTTFVSLSAPAGWTCTTPAVGAGGTVSCSNPSFTLGSAVFTLTVQVAPTVAGGTVLSNTVAITSATADPAPGSESATATTNVLSPATVSGTKTVSGDFAPGGAITYTIVLTNSGPSTQGDNPGDELTDVLPASLTLVSANATSGIAVATVGTNTVTWNGSLAASASVTITIQATISASAAEGTTITNQATFRYDANGDGTNEATGVTDAPGGTANDPTNFVVGGEEPQEIPTLDTLGLALLAVILALGGMALLRRRRNA